MYKALVLGMIVPLPNTLVETLTRDDGVFVRYERF